MRELKTVDGIMTMEVAGRMLKSGFCADSEGNILVIGNSFRG